MAYRASIASQISQFGKCIIDFNFIDDAGIMPFVRRSYKFNNIKPTNAEKTSAANSIRGQITQEYNDKITEENKMTTFKEWLGDKLNDKCSDVLDQIKTQIAQSNLTNQQKAIADRINIKWEIN